MALKISKNSTLTDNVSESNPITTQHNVTGGSIETRVFLYNDTATFTYEDIVISATDTVGTNESSWVTFAKDNNGAVTGTYASTISYTSIPTANTGVPFWVKVTTPVVETAQNKSDIRIRVVGKEKAV